MRIFVFTNEQNTFKQEFHTDFLTGMDNFTVHDIQFSSSTLTQDNLTAFGLNFERLPYTYAAFKAFAVTNNLTLTEIDYNDTSGTSLNAATAFSITTTAIKAGFAGQEDIQTVTPDTFANSTQGDYINITNWNGETMAVWLALDGVTTAPTGALYLASDYQIKVDIVTGDVAADIATKMVTAINKVNTVNYNGFVKDYIVVADTTGDFTITQTRVALVTATAPKDDDDVGVGSITVAATTAGVEPELELQTVSILDFAGMTTQADYIVLTNTQGETLAAWVDLNDAGTEPTAAATAYGTSDYQTRIDLQTADNTTTLTGAKLYDALTDVSVAAWNVYATIVDLTGGDVTIEQVNAGDVANAADYIADGSAGGGARFTVAETNPGVGGTLYAEVIATAGGNTPITYALKTSGDTDLAAGLSFNTVTATLEGIPEEAKAPATLNVTFTDAFGTAVEADIDFTINA